MQSLKNYRSLALLPVILLAGCNMVVMNPSGDVASQQADLIVYSTLLMLLVIVPVMVMTVIFALRYREGNNATYKPDWDHSTQLELAIWAAPLLIIVALGALTWISTHTLDPYRPITRIDEDRPVPAGTKPLVVEAIALDWKWLFIYPEQGIATVNELAAPVDRPIEFKITASSVMNSFYIPALAGQIYAMPGMETQLHAVINQAGEYEGLSANYSGAGFSGMHFKFHGQAPADFDKWVQGVKAGGGEALERANYLELEKPSQNVAVIHYANVAPDLYDAIVNRCLLPGQICISQMMAMDSSAAHGQANAAGAYGVVAAAAQHGPGDPRRRPYVENQVCVPGEQKVAAATSRSTPVTAALR